jgi:major vault protein
MIVVPPRHYCIIFDPYIRKNQETKEPMTDEFGQVKIRHGDREIRFAEDWPEPFPLMPGEKLHGSVLPLQMVQCDTALRLLAKRDFVDAAGKKVVAGDEWMFPGPATYVPRIEVEIKEVVTASIIKKDQALKLSARNAFTDRNGVERRAGENWLVRQVGSFLPGVDEIVEEMVRPKYLNQTQALHLRATNSFKDVYGIERKAGEEWLVTSSMSELHLQDIHEELMGSVKLTCLNKLQYCVVLDPVGPDGRNNYGKRELRKGESNFFLQPGERLEGGIQNVYVLNGEEALLLRAKETFKDGDTVRTPGDQWMILGPRDYIPVVEVEVVAKRQSIPLDENEGIYIRDTKTGQVKAIRGQTYMLQAHEELWAKSLSEEVEELLRWNQHEGASRSKQIVKKARDKTRVVDYRVPHNAAVQIYDYKVSAPFTLSHSP